VSVGELSLVTWWLQLEQVDNVAEVCSTSIGQVERHRRAFKLLTTLEVMVIIYVLHGVNQIENQEDWLSSDRIQYAGGQVSTAQTVGKKFPVGSRLAALSTKIATTFIAVRRSRLITSL